MELNESQKKLVENNVNIAYFMARKYYKTNYSLVLNKNLELDDLSQIALEELCIRAKTYSPEKSKPSTYFYSYLYQQIDKFVRNYNQVKIPSWWTWKDRNDEHKESLMNIAFGNIPSLDKPLEGWDSCLGDFIESENNSFESIELDSVLRESLDSFDYKLTKLRLEDLTQSEIAKVLKVSKSKVNGRLQHIKRILKKELLGEGV